MSIKKSLLTVASRIVPHQIHIAAPNYYPKPIRSYLLLFRISLIPCSQHIGIVMYCVGSEVRRLVQICHSGKVSYSLELVPVFPDQNIYFPISKQMRKQKLVQYDRLQIDILQLFCSIFVKKTHDQRLQIISSVIRIDEFILNKLCFFSILQIHPYDQNYQFESNK